MTGPPVTCGPVDSRVLLVGQAPGDKEPALARPFAWTAGKQLFKWFAPLGLDEAAFRQRVYMAAVCRCFPGKNPSGGDRVPSPDEVARCRPWLDREFELLRPELVIPVGRLAIEQFLPARPLVEQIGNGKWLPMEEAESLRDELFYQNAIQSYILTIPILNTIGMRDGSESMFGSGYNVLPIWKDRMDSRTWVPTPNADVIYSMSYLDLKKDGPLVVAAPPNVIGMFTDFQQRTISDVGAVGPDRARGGLYLLLPPDHDGEVPGGYFAFRSATNNVFLFFRTIMTQGENGPDPAPAVANAEQTRVYPLWTPEKDVKPMDFPNASGKRVNMMYPTDSTYWTKLKAYVDYEPVAAIDPVTRARLLISGARPFLAREHHHAPAPVAA